MIFLNDIEALVLAALSSDFVKQFEPLDFVFYLSVAVFCLMMLNKIIVAQHLVKKQQNWLIGRK